MPELPSYRLEYPTDSHRIISLGTEQLSINKNIEMGLTARIVPLMYDQSCLKIFKIGL